MPFADRDGKLVMCVFYENIYEQQNEQQNSDTTTNHHHRDDGVDFVAIECD